MPTYEATSCSKQAGRHLRLLVGSERSASPGSWRCERSAGRSWAAAGCCRVPGCTAGLGRWCTRSGCCWSRWIHTLWMGNGLDWFLHSHFNSYRALFLLSGVIYQDDIQPAIFWLLSCDLMSCYRWVDEMLIPLESKSPECPRALSDYCSRCHWAISASSLCPGKKIEIYFNISN